VNRFSKYRWSSSSIGITVTVALVNIAAKQYDPMWQPHSLVGRINGLGGVATIISFVLAMVSLFKNEPPLAGLLALFLSMASFLLYLR
jgi:hypothetical protein